MEKAQITERQENLKPESRVEPFLNIRNVISNAAITEVCATENMTENGENCWFGWHETSKAPKFRSNHLQ
jgi:hypothetical protein